MSATRQSSESQWPAAARAGFDVRAAVVALLLTAWLAGVSLCRYDHAPLEDDLAEYVNSPVRLLRGELPYRDFWLLHPPGEVLLPAAIYALGGGVNAVLLSGVAISVAIGLTSFIVAWRISGSLLTAGCGAILVFFAGVPANYVGYVYGHAYLLCLLVAAGFFHEYLRTQRQRWLFAAGVSIGVASCFRFYLAGAAAAALLATVVLEARQRRCGGGEMIRLSLVMCGGILLAPTALSLWFGETAAEMWRTVALDSVVHATTLRPYYGHYLVNMWPEVAVRIPRMWEHAHVWRHHTEAVLFTSLFAAAVAAHVLPFLAAGLWLFQRRNRHQDEFGPADWMSLFFLLWGGLVFIRGFSRGGIPQHLSQATTPLFFVLVLLWPALASRWRDARSFGVAFALGGSLLVLTGLAQRAPVYTLLQIDGCRTETFRVTAPFGSVACLEPQRAEELQGLIDAVLETTSPDEGFAALPYETPALYALTRRRNSTAYDSLIDVMYDPSDAKQQRVCRGLLSPMTRLVIHRPGWNFCGDPAFGTVEETCPLIGACVQDHFEPFRTVGVYTLYRRRNP